MADLAAQSPTWNAPALALTAADAANTFPADAGVALLVQNDNAGPVTLTFVSEVASPAPGLIAQNEAKVVPAGARHLIEGPGNSWNNFKDPTTGKVTVNLDVTASVLLAAVK